LSLPFGKKTHGIRSVINDKSSSTLSCVFVYQSISRHEAVRMEQQQSNIVIWSATLVLLRRTDAVETGGFSSARPAVGD
jgi:hypothetical protein